MSTQAFQMSYERRALVSLLKGDREALPHSIEGPALHIANMFSTYNEVRPL